MCKHGWSMVTFIAALALAGCGGGDNSSSFASTSSSSGGTPTPTVGSVTMATSLPQIPSDNSQTATVTAYVRDPSNLYLSGIPVSFKTNSGGLAVTTATTDSSGQATAKLDTGGDRTDRTITVTATAGKQSASIDVAVTGTSLALNGPSALIEGGAAGTYTVTLTGPPPASTPLSGATVSVTSSAGNTLSAASLATGSSGEAAFTLTGINAGSDTLTVTALGVSKTLSVVVSNQSFSITAPTANALIGLGVIQPVTVVWNTGGVAQSGKNITFSTTRGTFNGSSTATTASATTDSTGAAAVTIAAATAGPAIITASSGALSAQTQVTFVATVPTDMSLQASPGTVPVSGQSTISAIVRDANNNLVEGQTVDFQLTDVTGGSLSVGSAVTDVQGLATTVYTASNTASAAHGVSITASIPGTAVAPATVTLTVGGQTVFLSLGTGESIYESGDKTQFILPYTVQAVDAAGNAVNGVNITLNVKPLFYGKGSWAVTGSVWAQTTSATCANEDVLGNGILNASDASEDINGNGKLDPGNIAAVSPGTVTTAATAISTGTSTVTINGSAAMTLSYPEDHALWVQVKLTATATVQGTESSTSAVFWLPMLASYVQTTTATIPGVVSPYGVANTCANPN